MSLPSEMYLPTEQVKAMVKWQRKRQRVIDHVVLRTHVPGSRCGQPTGYEFQIDQKVRPT